MFDGDLTVVWDAVNFKILYFAESDMITKFGFKSFKFCIFSFFPLLDYYLLKAKKSNFDATEIKIILVQKIDLNMITNQNSVNISDL